MYFFLHACVEEGDEAHPGPRDLSDQRATPLGGSIGWLRIQRLGTGSAATGHPMSSEPCQSGTERIGRASPQCTATVRMDMSSRRRGW
jgi:hypothetical protein